MTPTQKPKLQILTGFNKKALQITSDLNESNKDLSETIATIIVEPTAFKTKRDDNNTAYIRVKGKVELKSNEGIIYTSKSLILVVDGYPDLVSEIRNTEFRTDKGAIRFSQIY